MTMPVHYHLEKLPDGSWAIIDDDTGKAVTTDPFSGLPTGENDIPPNTPNISGNQAGTGMGTAGGVGPMPDYVQFLVWIGAMVVLWFALTALAESGFAREANGMAGLLIFGALMFMGPKAIENAKKLTQPPQQQGA